MRRLTLATLAATAALFAPAIANAPPPVLVATWDADQIGDDWTLFYSSDIAISCPEGKKQLHILIGNVWDGAAATDKVTVTFGDKSFEATQIPAASGLDYVLPADADSVTAIMMANNAVVELTSDKQQIRQGTPDQGGAFDTFATTCAQINGLR